MIEMLHRGRATGSSACAQSSAMVLPSARPFGPTIAQAEDLVARLPSNTTTTLHTCIHYAATIHSAKFPTIAPPATLPLTMSHTECVLTVDGVEVPVCLDLLARRSHWFETVLNDTTDARKLSKLVQEAWNFLCAQASCPPRLSFTVFYHAIATGKADVSLLHQSSTCPDLVLSYFNTRQVSYGFVFVLVTEAYPDLSQLERWYAIPRERLSQDEVDYLATLKIQTPRKIAPHFKAISRKSQIALNESKILDRRVIETVVPFTSFYSTGNEVTMAQWEEYASHHELLQTIIIPLLLKW